MTLISFDDAIAQTSWTDNGFIKSLVLQEHEAPLPNWIQFCKLLKLVKDENVVVVLLTSDLTGAF